MLTIEYAALKALIHLEGSISDKTLNERLVLSLNAHDWDSVAMVIVGKSNPNYSDLLRLAYDKFK